MADFKELNSLLGEYAVPEKTETGDSGSDLHSLLGEYGDENTKTLSAPKSHKSLATDIVQDVGIGTLELPGAVTGLADIPAGLMGLDRPFSKGAEKLGEATGFQPGKWAEEAEKTVYSPERVAAEQRVSKAWEDYDTDKTGIFSAVGKTLAEPRVLAGTVFKSAPSMAGGMGLARGARALAPSLSPVVAGAGGEGAVMAGQQMDQIDESVDPQRAAIASALTGVGGGALSYGMGKVAGKLGLTDIETAAAGGKLAEGVSALPAYKRIPGGMVSEGLLEEAPQSALEQASQNIAEDKDVTEGMGRAVVQGTLAGGVMGAGANILPSGEAAPVVPPATEEQVLPQEPDFAEVPDTEAREPIIAGAHSDLDLRTDEEKAAERQDRFNDLSARFYGTSDTDTVFEGKQVTIPGRPKEFLSPEEKAELGELEKEFGTPVDLGTPEVAVAKAVPPSVKGALRGYVAEFDANGGMPEADSRFKLMLSKAGIKPEEGEPLEKTFARLRAVADPKIKFEKGEYTAPKNPEEALQRASGYVANMVGNGKVPTSYYNNGKASSFLKALVGTGLYDHNDTIGEAWQKLQDFVAPKPVVPATPNTDAAVEKSEVTDANLKANLGAGTVSRAAGAAIDNRLTPEQKQNDLDVQAAAALDEQQNAEMLEAERVAELGDLEPEIPWEEYDDSIPFGEPAHVVPLTPEELENMRITREAKIHGIREEPEAEASPFLQARYDANKAQQEAQDALKKQEASPLDDGGIPLAGTGEGNGDFASDSTGVSPEGQAVGDIPSAEEKTLTQTQTPEVEDGKSPYQTTQTTAPEVTEANEVWTNTEAQAEKANKLIAESEKRGVPIKTYSLFKMGSGTNEVILSTGNKAISIDANGNHDTFHMPTLQLNIAAGNAKEFTGKLDPTLRKPVLPTESKPTAKQGGIAAGVYRSPSAPSTPVYKVDESGAIFRANTLGNWVKLSARAKDPLANLNSVRWELENNGLKFEREDLAPETPKSEVSQELQEAGITEEFPIDLQAHKEAAASRFNGHRVLPENRDAQKKAYVTVKDLNIGIENPAGTKRKEEWPELKDHYGFVVGVKGADGDYLDVFIQPKLSPEAIENIQKVFVVDQKNEDGSFDEHKVILGPDNVEAAKDLYLENYEPGWQGLGAITEMPFDEFKARIESGANWDTPIAYKEPAVEEKPKAKEVKTPEGGKLTKTQMRDSLIAEIDEAIAAAPKTQSVYGQETEEIKHLQNEYKNYGTTEQRKHEITKEIQDLYSLQEDRLTFKIPGGTRFKVLNTKPSLEEFKKKVLASPGFKATTRAAPSKPKAPSFSVSNMIAEFLKDNEFDNAYYAAQEAGVRLGFGTSEKENTIPVYTDLEPVDLIPGRKMFVGRRFAKIEYKDKTEVKTYWHVIDEDSGASFSSGSNKKDAIATAEKAIKERAGIDGGKRLTELLEQAEARGANQEQLLAKFKKLNGIEDELVEESDVKFSRTETGEPLPELFESLGRVNKLSQLSDDQLNRIDEHPDAERIRYVQDNFLDLLSELDTNNKVQIKC